MLNCVVCVTVYKDAWQSYTFLYHQTAIPSKSVYGFHDKIILFKVNDVNKYNKK